MTPFAVVIAGAAGVGLLLCIPLPQPKLAPPPDAGRPFAWNRDSLWQSLESAFVAARSAGCGDSTSLALQITTLGARLAALSGTTLPPSAPLWDSLETQFFALAPRVAACPSSLDGFVATYSALRKRVKQQSEQWDVSMPEARDRLYRGLYGGRAALEEVLVQQPGRVDALLHERDEPSISPAAIVRGVRVHCGDILVSRGGYPTSALIARGNDYPGNFSHVGLVHVDSSTQAVSVIEAHIERGVAIGSADEYLADKKLRLMVLRPRAGLAAMKRDPLLPHRAASAMRERSLTERIRYDFAMDYRDPSRLFCSEVASSTYRDHGITLWAGISTISREGLRRWLGGFGVRHFETQEPSDLEYDPQLVVVAEWHDPALLFREHIANAVTDAMLEGADRGDRLRAPWHQLPMARLAKGYSWLVQRLGMTGVIPEGMTPAAALRNRRYSEWHAALTDAVTATAEAWAVDHGYRPTYWTLVQLARDASQASL